MAHRLAAKNRDKSEEGEMMKGTGTATARERSFPIVVESDADGYFVSCPVLQGCYSQGDTYEEALANIRDAIKLHVKDRLASGEEIPERISVSLSTVEVTV